MSAALRRVADHIAAHPAGVNMGPAYEQDGVTLKEAVHATEPEVEWSALGGPHTDWWRNAVEAECASVFEYGMPTDTFAEVLRERAAEIEKE